MRYVLMLGVFASVVVGGQAVYAKVDCEPARCAVQATVDQECPCLGVPTGTTAANHGQHVSCVAHAVNKLAKSGTIPKNCKGKVTKCAAKSICGKDGFVTCNIPLLGTCDTTTGTCADNAMVTCTSDADCVIGTKCKIKSSADLCMMAGGTVGTGTSCCADCSTTP
jgi:hypothetical protein